MNAIIKEIVDNEKFKDCLDNINKKISPINILGLTDVAKVLSLTVAKETCKRPICLITYNEIQAKKLLEDIKYFNSKVVYLPKKDIVTYDYIAESKDLPYERIEALNRIYNGSADIVVTTIEACMQKMISPKELYSNVIKFEFNKEYKFEEIKEKLVKLGYERAELIEGKGQFSVRGDIIDIAITTNKGVRVEFWGDEIDSIRYFNISSQRSIEELNEIVIYPAHEYIVTNNIENIVNNIRDKYIGEYVQEDIELIKEGNYISKIDKYLTCFYNKTANVLDYLKNNAIIFLDEIGKIKTRAENISKDTQMLIQTLTEKEKSIPEILQYLESYEAVEE